MNSNNPKLNQLADMLNSKKQFDILEYWHIFWRKKWLLVGVSFFITIAAVIYALLFIRPIYKVSAAITIESKSILNTTLGGVSTTIATNLDRQRILRKVYSPDYLNELADILELRDFPVIKATALSYRSSANWLSEKDALERATLAYLRNKLDVTVSARGDQFHVSVQDTSPVFAFKMVDAMTKIFVNQSRQNDLRGIRDVKKFSEEQLSVYKAKMDKAENKLREFNEKMATDRTIEMNPDNSMVKFLTNLKEKTNQNVEERLQRIALLENRIPQNIIQGISVELDEMIALEQSVMKKQDDYKRVLENDGPNSSPEMQLNNELNLLRLESNRVIDRAIDRAFPNLKQTQRNSLDEYILGSFDLYILKSRLAVITQVLNKTIRSSAAQPALVLVKRRLEDEYEQHRRTYRVFLEKSRGMQIEEAIQHSDAEYKYQSVMPAQMPIYAVGGSKKNFVLIAIAFSLIAGIGLVLILDFLDQTIRSDKDVEQFIGLAILGAIPKMNRPFEELYADIERGEELSPPRNGRARTIEELRLMLDRNAGSDHAVSLRDKGVDLRNITQLSRS